MSHHFEILALRPHFDQPIAYALSWPCLPYMVKAVPLHELAGAWCLVLSCGHFVIARGNQEAIRLMGAGFPIRCKMCGERGREP